MQKRHSQLWQSSWNWSCGGLTSVVLIVLGTVNFQLTHWKRPWCWKRLRAGGEVDDGGWDDWMASSTQRTWVWVDSELVMDREAWRAAVRRVTKSWTQLSGWTELNWIEHLNSTLEIMFLEIESSTKLYVKFLCNQIRVKFVTQSLKKNPTKCNSGKKQCL